MLNGDENNEGGDDGSGDDASDDDASDDDEDVEEWLNGSSSGSEVNLFELNSNSAGEAGSDVSMQWTTDEEGGD